MSQVKPTDIEATKYAESYVLYGDQTRAWKAVFPASKAKMESIHARACEFHKKSKVLVRIKELHDQLKKQSEEKFSLTAESLQKTLASVMELGLIEKTDSQGNSVAHALPAVVSAVAEINKMNGNYAPSKIGIGSDPDAPPFNISRLTDEQLEAELEKYGIQQSRGS